MYPSSKGDNRILSGLGVYHGSFNWKATGDNLVDNTQLFPYPQFPTPGMETQDAPISMALTEFHFVLLYKDRIAAICGLDERLAYEEVMPVVGVIYCAKGDDCMTQR